VPGFLGVRRPLPRGPLGQYRSRTTTWPGSTRSRGFRRGNVGYLDGSSRWKDIREMKTYESGEWAAPIRACVEATKRESFPPALQR